MSSFVTGSVIQDLRSFCQNKTVYAKDRSNLQASYGKVQITEDNRLFVHCFEPAKPKGEYFIIPFNILLSRFGKPTTAFLKLGINDKISYEAGSFFIDEKDTFSVVIETNGENCRERNFLYICSGLKGHSFIDRILACYSIPFYKISGRAIPHMVEGDLAQYSTSNRRGMVWEMNEKKSAFMIWMNDKVTPNTFRVPLGEVTEGMEKMTEMYEADKKLKILDTGLIFEQIY